MPRTVPISDEVMKYLDDNGLEAVRFDRTNRDDQFLAYGQSGVYVDCGTDGWPRLIVQPKWTPPNFLQPGWVYSNNGKEWWHSTDKPTPQESRYSGQATLIAPWIVKFDPPHWTDWRSSLHQIH